MKTKIAKFRSLGEYPCTIVIEREEKDLDMPLQGYVRLSDWVSVEFPLRRPDELVPEQLAVLDEAEKSLRLKFEQKLHEIAGERAKLLCLTHEAPHLEAVQ
jgi:hypothetical protein